MAHSKYLPNVLKNTESFGFGSGFTEGTTAQMIITDENQNDGILYTINNWQYIEFGKLTGQDEYTYSNSNGVYRIESTSSDPANRFIMMFPVLPEIPAGAMPNQYAIEINITDVSYTGDVPLLLLQNLFDSQNFFEGLGMGLITAPGQYNFMVQVPSDATVPPEGAQLASDNLGIEWLPSYGPLGLSVGLNTYTGNGDYIEFDSITINPVYG